jgi:anthranilate phosphoribosyltransferase
LKASNFTREHLDRGGKGPFKKFPVIPIHFKKVANMIQSAVAKVVEKVDLTFDEARESVSEIFAGNVPASQVAGFLIALRMKGETVDEIAGAAEAMRGAATRIHLPDVSVIADTCGTGGDKQGSFNISTAAAFVVAGAGFVVAKHGNRSISSVCGSADVLEALGVKIDPPVAVVERCLKAIGIGFMFAPAFHPAMKHAMPVRRELGVRTVFNLLGPLTNPAGANAQVIGVFSDKMVDVIAQVLVRLGTRHSMVVHGAGHDEITLFGNTHVVDIVDGRASAACSDARGFWVQAACGVRLARRGQRGKCGNSPPDFFGRSGAPTGRGRGERRRGHFGGQPRRGTSGCQNIETGAGIAEHSIDSGAAKEKLEKLVAMSQA